MRAARSHQWLFTFVIAFALLAVMTVPTPRSAQAYAADDVVINEIVAANDSYFDSFGDTPDWIELQNSGTSAVVLTGWTISDGAEPWVIPTITLAPGQRVVLFASGRDLTAPERHTNFSLKRNGETLTLADSDGLLVDSVAYPTLDDDQSFGRGPAGGLGYLVTATPGAANSVLAPSRVSITTPPQTFEGSLQISLAGTAGPGEQIRYTTNGDPVTPGANRYNGPFTISESTVVRTAVVGDGVVGPDSSAGYIATSPSISGLTSTLPIVLVHSTGAVGQSTQDAIISVIDRGPNGTASLLGEADYTGFAGLRIRGASSQDFPKKQYKLELWGERLGDEVDAELLGLGSDSDWGLYAPGVHDRALINNPFMYELAKELGVVAPDSRFVELYLEDNASNRVGSTDYLGIYVLRETIKITNERVPITEHTQSSAGPDGGYIIRYDWDDDCCRNIMQTRFGSYVAVDRPSDANITSGQFSYISDYWFDTLGAAEDSFEAVDAYLDFDSIIDGWLLEMLALDTDILRASHYLHMDAGGQLRAGPLWDYDRSLGGADFRIATLEDAETWFPGLSGHSWDSELYDDLWVMPEVQARLRARWAELRAPGGVFNDAALSTRVFAMGSELLEAYPREDARWGNDSQYGSRFGDLTGELTHMSNWVQHRAGWIDGQFLTDSSPPTITIPSQIQFAENTAFSYQVQASDSQTMVYSAQGLPEGLSINTDTGLISGIVGFGDGYQAFPVTITVADSSGAASTANVSFVDPAGVASRPNPVLLNEFNAVAPGSFLQANGSDTTFGRVGGNGGDWFELVTIEDRLDMRGWTFDLFSNRPDGDVVQTASLILNQGALLSDLRAGTIITVAESVPDDLSYDPAAGDWTINLQSTNSQLGAMWSNQTDFDTNHKRWRLVIRDAGGNIVSLVGGETEQWRDVGVGQNLANSESFGLAVSPAATVTSAALYADGNTSSFGAPNVLAGGVQDFSALRPELAELGDVNCSGGLNVADALIVAQYAVGNRTDSGGCPLGNIATQINADSADVNRDGNVNVGDALLIAQCVVGNPNAFCSE